MLAFSPKTSPNIPIGVTNRAPIPQTMPIITPEAIAMRSGASSWASTVATGWLANKDIPATIKHQEAQYAVRPDKGNDCGGGNQERECDDPRAGVTIRQVAAKQSAQGAEQGKGGKAEAADDKRDGSTVDEKDGEEGPEAAPNCGSECHQHGQQEQRTDEGLGRGSQPTAALLFRFGGGRLFGNIHTDEVVDGSGGYQPERYHQVGGLPGRRE